VVPAPISLSISNLKDFPNNSTNCRRNSYADYKQANDGSNAYSGQQTRSTHRHDSVIQPTSIPNRAIFDETKQQK
jgi:hypothetical protein